MRPRVGIAVIGFGWMGQAHSRSYLRLPTLFDGLAAAPELVVCADTVEARREQAVARFEFREGAGLAARGSSVSTSTSSSSRRRTCSTSRSSRQRARPASTSSARNLSAGHRRRRRACSRAGRGRDHGSRLQLPLRAARRLHEAARTRAGWAPSSPIAVVSSRCTAATRCSWSWRFLQDEAGYGVSSDLLSHAVDLGAHARRADPPGRRHA